MAAGCGLQMPGPVVHVCFHAGAAQKKRSGVDRNPHEQSVKQRELTVYPRKTSGKSLSLFFPTFCDVMGSHTMPDMAFRFRRKLKYIHRRFREWRMLWKGIASTDHPVLAHIIPMRRCNLACAYCNEYDDVSKPAPLATMTERLDQLAALGTTVVSISGGEPLMHPELDEIVAHIRRRGMMAGMITNGYLLTAQRIQRLNRAGLEHIQISIDNVLPDDVSKKSLKVLDKKLQLLAEHADFHVNINSVVGGGIRDPKDALLVGRRALELGFSATVGIIHDGDGQLRPLGERERAVYHEMKAME